MHARAARTKDDIASLHVIKAVNYTCEITSAAANQIGRFARRSAAQRELRISSISRFSCRMELEGEKELDSRRLEFRAKIYRDFAF